jgi:tRNA(Ile2) C34 agmatinyltransferase TiaS
LLDYAVDFVRQNTYSQETTIAVFQGLRVPDEVKQYGLDAKSVIFKVNDARGVAERNDIKLIEVTGKRGTIGAVAAVGCFDLGMKASSLPEDFAQWEK